MKYEPHDYQKFAVDFIETHPQAAILIGCGLGKTSITLTALNDLMFDRFEVKKPLIIAPIRVCRNSWAAEIEKWDHLSNLTYSLVLGTSKERLAALQKKADLYIINRENVQWLIEQSGVAFDFDMVIIDEMSSFKNHQSKRFRALRKVRPFIKRIVGLTGTPCSNGLLDLWAQFRLIDKGERLGKQIGQYRNEYFTPDWNGFTYTLKHDADKKIYHKISDISISMKTTDHLKMPELISVSVPVYLSYDELQTYEEMEKQYTLPLLNSEITAANAASLTLKLSQMANGAIYTDDKDVVTTHDRKLDALEDLVESANGKPVLVAYWFKHDKDRIQQRMEARELKEPQDFADWNAGKIPVALIHPASAGHGLNLQQGGSILVWFGLTWSLELYQQTNARLWRQGQADKTVIIQHIVAKDTIDERILKVLEHKDGTQPALIEAVKADLGMTETENGGIL